MSVLTAIFAFSPARAAAQQCACPTNTTTPETVYEQAVSINTFVQTSTTFNPIPEVAVTITDAPTNLDGITTFHWTSTSITTTSTSQYSTSSTMVQTPAPSLNAFVLRISSADPRQTNPRRLGRKRQAGAVWVAPDGLLSGDCTNSPVYSVTNGTLTALVNGTTYTYSTSPVWATRCLRPARFPEPLRQLSRLEAMAC